MYESNFFIYLEKFFEIQNKRWYALLLCQNWFYGRFLGML